MNKKIMTILGIVFIIITISFNITYATETEDDNEFSNLTMEIVIDEDATAKITEVWEVSIYDGTEMYKPYYFDNSEIQNFSVIDENETEYEFLSDWDIDASQDEKTEKCGIYEEDDATELCWGIGEYGTHTYTLSYEITNFVSYYSDEEVQKTSITLIPKNMDPLPQNAEITISANFDFNDDNIVVTSNGFTGSTKIEDGVIKISTTSAISSSQYVDLTVEYEEEPFSVSNTIQSSNYTSESNEFYEENFMREKPSFWQKYGRWIILLIIVIVIIVVIIFINKKKNKKNQDDNYIIM